MANVVVVGSQWGDEGKGKIVDWLSHHADVVIRFQGGHNAGHTLVIDGTTYKLHMLPSGVVRPGILSIIGNGVVLDPWNLLQEIDVIRQQGIEVTPETLKIAENTPLILPLHRHLDIAREEKLGKAKIGTTGRGIGPAYEDKIARRAIRLCDLAENTIIEEKVKHLLFHHNALLRGWGFDELKSNEVIESLKEIAPKVLPYSDTIWQRLDTIRKTGKRILFEGAQGMLLDIDHGTYPFVTSSNVAAAQAAIGSSQGLNAIDYVLGITKAYTTRVGSGPFPSEQKNKIGQQLGERGHEFGTTTGRLRRCGWFDAVLVRQAVKVGGIDGIALTKLDVLDEFDELKICIAYTLNGERLNYLPACQLKQANIKPVYETIKGWGESTQGRRSWADFPARAIKYIRRIEELIEVPVAMLSTSPEREDTILVHDPFEDL